MLAFSNSSDNEGQAYKAHIFLVEFNKYLLSLFLKKATLRVEHFFFKTVPKKNGAECQNHPCKAFSIIFFSVVETPQNQFTQPNNLKSKKSFLQLEEKHYIQKLKNSVKIEETSQFPLYH